MIQPNPEIEVSPTTSEGLDETLLDASSLVQESISEDKPELSTSDKTKDPDETDALDKVDIHSFLEERRAKLEQDVGLEKLLTVYKMIEELERVEGDDDATGLLALRAVRNPTIRARVV